MELFRNEWVAAIEKRRAQRSYDNQSLNAPDLARLKKFALESAPVKGARAVVLEDGAQEVFKGMQGAYGAVRGCESLAIFIVDTRLKHGFEEMGYLGEALILEATAMGLASCWIGGAFRPDVAGRFSQMAEGEKIAAVAALGYSVQNATARLAQAVTSPRMRAPLASLVTGLPEKAWPAWMRKALEAARLAPSHMNRQPVRYLAAEDSITVQFEGTETEDGINKRLECGIAMLHIETAARAAGKAGRWEYSEAAGEAARYLVK